MGSEDAARPVGLCVIQVAVATNLNCPKMQNFGIM